MFPRKTHRRLVAAGAPELPDKYFYHPTVKYIGDRPFVSMEIRRRRGLRSVVVSHYVIDPEKLLEDDGESMATKVSRLCRNAVLQCHDFDTEWSANV